MHKNRLALLQASEAKQHVICCNIIHRDGSCFFICHAFRNQFTVISWYRCKFTPKTKLLHTCNSISDLAIVKTCTSTTCIIRRITQKISKTLSHDRTRKVPPQCTTQYRTTFTAISGLYSSSEISWYWHLTDFWKLSLFHETNILQSKVCVGAQTDSLQEGLLTGRFAAWTFRHQNVSLTSWMFHHWTANYKFSNR